MKFKNKYIPQAIVTLVLILGVQSLTFAQDDNTLGAQAYLSIKTWSPSEKYNAAHFLMVPLYYAYKNNNIELKAQFNDHIKKFLADENKRIDVTDISQRLNNLQYFYFLSEYAVLAKNQELAKYLLDNISKFWLDVPAPQWGMSPLPNARDRILWKLQAGADVGYKRLIIDEEFFIFGTAANLLKLYSENKTLIDIRDLALDVFKQRSEFDPQGAWLFDKGVFDNYPDYAYAGYNSTNNITKPKPLKNMVSDSSHFFRIPKILLSLQNSYIANSDNYNLYKSYRTGLNQQFLSKVVQINNNNIFLTNYMDGRNGVFRWNYSVKNKGIGPYKQTYAFGIGWWVFLKNPKVKDLYVKYYNQVRLDGNECNSLMKSIISKKEMTYTLNFQKCEIIYNSYLASRLNI
ncbi:hypothetical protein ACEN3H_18115 [Acinetobacter lactucae]|uniref:hypothetical protein n=1 Tax=Acinetobacter lactucae TaxID=1785128 RepID=UPI00358DA4E2